MDAEEASAIVVDTAYHMHRGLGSGLLESVYLAVMSRSLARQGLRVERQKPLPFHYDGMQFSEGLRVDLLVEECLVVELKSVESIVPAHTKQLLTYLRLLDLSLGLLINFGAPLFKHGVRRVVNGHVPIASSRLRLHQRSAD